MNMKQLMMTLLMALVTLTASAQEKNDKALNEKFFNARLGEMVYVLDLNDEQQKKFAPVYRRYCNEMRTVMGKPRRPEKAEKGKQPTDEERLARTKQRMERQQKAQALRIRYVDEFAAFLTADQVERFFKAEEKIHHKLMDRKAHHKGKFHGEKGFTEKAPKHHFHDGDCPKNMKLDKKKAVVE